MPSRFVPSRSGIAAFGRSPQLMRALHRKADHVKTIVIPMTPVGPERKQPEERMKGSWETGAEIRAGRAVGLIWNTARNRHNGYRYPAAVEHGNGRIKAQRVLGRALTIAERG